MSDDDHKAVFIITGETGSGKTTFLLQLVEELRRNAFSMAGFAAVSVPGEGPTEAYQILDLDSGRTLPLASRGMTEGWEPYGNFYFNPEGIQMGTNILEDPVTTGRDLIVVDEVGPLELKGHIWANSLSRLLARRSAMLLLVVRASLVERVMHQWKLGEVHIFDIRQTKPEQAAAVIRSASAAE